MDKYWENIVCKNTIDVNNFNRRLGTIIGIILLGTTVEQYLRTNMFRSQSI